VHGAAISRVGVDSSSLASVGYDSVGQVLEVEFRHGSVYRYMGVPVETYEALLGAGSKGRYLNGRIKGQYAFLRAG